MSLGKYGIQRLSSHSETIIWRHETLKGAEDAAYAVAQRHHCECIVFEILSTFAPTIEHRDADGRPFPQGKGDG